MRLSFASSAQVAALLGGVFGLGGCSGDVAVGSSDDQLQTQTNGEPTGDGSTCSWAGTTFRPADDCEAVPTPAGYGPYEVGDDFPSPDGCNECSCTEQGIMCTVKECASGGNTDPEPVACTDDAKVCSDGSSVGREGPSCEFAPCPGEEDAAVPGDDCSVACTLEALLCADGSSVGRVAPDCEFALCPDEEPVACTDDAMECPDGSSVGRVAPDCEFALCPDDEPVGCTLEAMECPDGSFVGRVAPDCEFAPCPDDEPVVCDADARECPDGSVVSRIAPDCEFAPCPDDEVICTGDVLECNDGSFVSRTGPDCEFAPCPYDPCEGKTCGDTCTLCAPDDADCGETAVLKTCSADGVCDAGQPACL